MFSSYLTENLSVTHVSTHSLKVYEELIAVYSKYSVSETYNDTVWNIQSFLMSLQVVHTVTTGPEVVGS
jgi:hypothetical protein